uniref:Uncharacterized protein n=1 Tax=viral metagenome TaxID=1070528 RepID=A0A6M3K4T1_9ZZZZ
MKQITDKVDWAFYTLLFLALGLWLIFMIYVPVKLDRIEKLVTPKTEYIPKIGDCEDLIRDFKAQRDGKL